MDFFKVTTCYEDTYTNIVAILGIGLAFLIMVVPLQHVTKCLVDNIIEFHLMAVKKSRG